MRDRGASAPPGRVSPAGPPMSKTAYVLERLRTDIAEGLIVPGTALRQAEIAERYGVSATPVREALRLLEAAGTISYAPNRGATVREMSATRTDDLYLLRAEIEGLATALGVERMPEGTVEEVRAIQAELIEIDDPGDGRRLALLNRQLHFTIYEAGSPLIAAHVASLWSLFPPHVTIWSDREAAKALTADHEGIIAAMEARDPELARERAAAHILHAASLRKDTP